MIEKSSLSKYTAALAAVLEIEPPTISFEEPDGMTATQLGALDLESRDIWVRRTAEDADKLFAIAHEMRHLWQAEKRPEMLTGYVSAANINNVAYNNQDAELDANAFAVAIMRAFFGLVPLFTGVDENLKRDIRARADVISRKLEEKAK